MYTPQLNCIQSIDHADTVARLKRQATQQKEYWQKNLSRLKEVQLQWEKSSGDNYRLVFRNQILVEQVNTLKEDLWTLKLQVL